jgi:DNA-damage-inducible protein D
MATADFDQIRQENPHGEPYWSARDLAPLLGYKKWQRFEDAITRAMDSCRTNGNAVERHFTPTEKPIVGGHGAVQNAKDWLLSKYGCWLIAMNGDVRKPEIAAAQAYFLVSTAENEMHKLRMHQQQRLMLR